MSDVNILSGTVEQGIINYGQMSPGKKFFKSFSFENNSGENFTASNLCIFPQPKNNTFENTSGTPLKSIETIAKDGSNWLTEDIDKDNFEGELTRKVYRGRVYKYNTVTDTWTDYSSGNITFPTSVNEKLFIGLDFICFNLKLAFSTPGNYASSIFKYSSDNSGTFSAMPGDFSDETSDFSGDGNIFLGSLTRALWKKTRLDNSTVGFNQYCHWLEVSFGAVTQGAVASTFEVEYVYDFDYTCLFGDATIYEVTDDATPVYTEKTPNIEYLYRGFVCYHSSPLSSPTDELRADYSYKLPQPGTYSLAFSYSEDPTPEFQVSVDEGTPIAVTAGTIQDDIIEGLNIFIDSSADDGDEAEIEISELCQYIEFATDNAGSPNTFYNKDIDLGAILSEGTETFYLQINLPSTITNTDNTQYAKFFPYGYDGVDTSYMPGNISIICDIGSEIDYNSTEINYDDNGDFISPPSPTNSERSAIFGRRIYRQEGSSPEEEISHSITNNTFFEWNLDNFPFIKCGFSLRNWQQELFDETEPGLFNSSYDDNLFKFEFGIDGGNSLIFPRMIIENRSGSYQLGLTFVDEISYILNRPVTLDAYVPQEFFEREDESNYNASGLTSEEVTDNSELYINYTSESLSSNTYTPSPPGGSLSLDEEILEENKNWPVSVIIPLSAKWILNDLKSKLTNPYTWNLSLNFEDFYIYKSIEIEDRKPIEIFQEIAEAAGCEMFVNPVSENRLALVIQEKSFIENPVAYIPESLYQSGSLESISDINAGCFNTITVSKNAIRQSPDFTYKFQVNENITEVNPLEIDFGGITADIDTVFLEIIDRNYDGGHAEIYSYIDETATTCTGIEVTATLSTDVYEDSAITVLVGYRPETGAEYDEILDEGIELECYDAAHVLKNGTIDSKYNISNDHIPDLRRANIIGGWEIRNALVNKSVNPNTIFHTNIKPGDWIKTTVNIHNISNENVKIKSIKGNVSSQSYSLETTGSRVT